MAGAARLRFLHDSMKSKSNAPRKNHSFMQGERWQRI